MRAAQARTPFLPSSVHLAESPEEVELLDYGGGAVAQLLERLGAWDPGWTPPACSPVRYLDQMRVLDSTAAGRARSWSAATTTSTCCGARGTTVVTCPRSNRYVGVGDPPVTRFYRSGVAVAVGTDSLASNDDLNLFAELAALRRLAPSVPAATLLESATLVGARALGSTPAPAPSSPASARALIAVALPPEVVDVEEYLVSGVTPDRVHWVEDLIAECGFADRA